MTQFLFLQGNTRSVVEMRVGGDGRRHAAVGTRLSLKVNDTVAWEVDDFKPPCGPLGIEAEGHAIDFRNLRIKSLRK